MQRIAPVLLALLLAAPATAAAPRPDLTVRSVGPVTGGAIGTTVTFTDTTRNTGRRRARVSRTAWYISSDRIKSRGDRRLARRRVPALRPRRSSRGSTRIVLPSTTGTFFVIACADDTRRVRERSERNNCRVAANRILIHERSTILPPVGPGEPGGGGGGSGGGGSGPGVVNPETPPPVVGGCQIFPADNAWNRDISGEEVDPMSSTYIKHMAEPAGDDWNLRLDMGSSEEFYGIPWTLVPQNQPLVTLQYGVGAFPDYEDPNDPDYENYADESDPGPYPIPPDVHIEGGSAADPDPTDGDRHTIVIRQGDCMLFETYKTVREQGSFQVASSADWDLKVNDTRPAGWTSADAAGLPIFPGLLRREDFEAGAVNHALRFTAPRAQRAYTAPASHFGTQSNTCKPPYGLRMRLKADFDETPYSEEGRVLIRALKRFGLMYADQGSSGYVSGTSNPAFESLIEEINQTRRIPHTAFEVVKLGEIVRGFADAPCSDT